LVLALGHRAGGGVYPAVEGVPEHEPRQLGEKSQGGSAFQQIGTDAGGRRNAILQAERKSALGKAPAYMYEWDYESPGFGGKFGAVHGTDVSASFYNFRDGIGGTGSPQEKALWQRFASCWVSLARTGNPNWPAYDSDKRATMIFNTESHVENDPRSEIRSFWQEMPTARRG